MQLKPRRFMTKSQFSTSSFPIKTNPDIHATDNHSLQTFMRKFERTYLNYGVDVERHWFFYLEASFENNNSYNSWFVQNFKSSCRNKPKTWTEAKATVVFEKI
ncbi:hypothetical protein INT47_002999 [Mucor saturninus]|uniref:Uncharacterized protein n=1 Tax=Mucor saturninus TaxID=64648 RepID=A0A8H7QSJ5_9FUNG|nr:hypothetical protein INT47_002999 [Mucor saturninus]